MSDDLINRAKLAQNITPPTNGTNTNSNGADHTTQPKQPGSTKIAKAWLNLSEHYEEIPVEETEEVEPGTQADPEKKGTKGDPNWTKRDGESSATTFTNSYDLAQTTIFYLVEVLRYKKAFKNYDWKRVKTILNEQRQNLGPEEKILFDRVLKAQKKFKGRKDEIKMAKDELEQMQRSMFGYYEQTQTKLDPKVIMWSNIITNLGKKGIDIAMDDGY